MAPLVQQLLATRSQLATLTTRIPGLGRESDYYDQLSAISQKEKDLSWQFAETDACNVSGDFWVEPAAVRRALPKDAVLIESAFPS